MDAKYNDNKVKSDKLYFSWIPRVRWQPAESKKDFLCTIEKEEIFRQNMNINADSLLTNGNYSTERKRNDDY